MDPVVAFTDNADLARAYELLGQAHYFLGDRETARTHFSKLVRLRPDKELDPLVIPPPVIAFYEELRQPILRELEADRDVIRKAREEEEARRRAELTVHHYVETRRNSRLVAALPFGAGQFQNGDTGLGAAFLSTELVATGLSVAFFLAVEDLRQDDGRFASEDIDRAASLQTAQLVSGGIALALAIAGIVEAQINFRETTLIERVEGPKGAGRRTAPVDGSPPAGLLRFRF